MRNTIEFFNILVGKLRNGSLEGGLDGLFDSISHSTLEKYRKDGANIGNPITRDVEINIVTIYIAFDVN